jgi:hypothetical protein
LVFKLLCSSVMNFGVNLIQTRHIETFFSRGEPTCDVTPRHATSSSPPHRRAHMPEQVRDCWSEARLREHCVPTGRDTPPTPTPVPRGRSTHARVHADFRHWLERRMSPTASAPCRHSCRPRSSGETASMHRLAYKTPTFFSLAHAREHRRPPPSAISAAGELPPPLAPMTSQRLQATP